MGKALALQQPSRKQPAIRTLIVDDEEFARDRLREMCALEADIEIVGECSHGSAAVREIELQRPHLVLLDVQMRGHSGFDVLRDLTGSNAPLVVFVTAFENHALEAFAADAVDYLLKPFDRERLQQALRRVRQRLGAPNGLHLGREILAAVRDELTRAPVTDAPRPARRIVAERDERLTFIDPQDIDCIEANRNHIWIHVGRDCFRLRCTMQQAEAMLDPGCFLRIHRSVIVNFLRIREMERWFHGEYVVTLKNGQRFTSGRGYRQRIQACMRSGIR